MCTSLPGTSVLISIPGISVRSSYFSAAANASGRPSTMSWSVSAITRTPFL